MLLFLWLLVKTTPDLGFAGPKHCHPALIFNPPITTLVRPPRPLLHRGIKNQNWFSVSTKLTNKQAGAGLVSTPASSSLAVRSPSSASSTPATRRSRHLQTSRPKNLLRPGAAIPRRQATRGSIRESRAKSLHGGHGLVSERKPTRRVRTPRADLSSLLLYAMPVIPYS